MLPIFSQEQLDKAEKDRKILSDSVSAYLKPLELIELFGVHLVNQNMMVASRAMSVHSQLGQIFYDATHGTKFTPPPSVVMGDWFAHTNPLAVLAKQHIHMVRLFQSDQDASAPQIHYDALFNYRLNELPCYAARSCTPAVIGLDNSTAEHYAAGVRIDIRLLILLINRLDDQKNQPVEGEERPAREETTLNTIFTNIEPDSVVAQNKPYVFLTQTGSSQGSVPPDILKFKFLAPYVRAAAFQTPAESEWISIINNGSQSWRETLVFTFLRTLESNLLMYDKVVAPSNYPPYMRHDGAKLCFPVANPAAHPTFLQQTLQALYSVRNDLYAEYLAKRGTPFEGTQVPENDLPYTGMMDAVEEFVAARQEWMSLQQKLQALEPGHYIRYTFDHDSLYVSGGNSYNTMGIKIRFKSDRYSASNEFPSEQYGPIVNEKAMRPPTDVPRIVPRVKGMEFLEFNLNSMEAAQIYTLYLAAKLAVKIQNATQEVRKSIQDLLDSEPALKKLVENEAK